MDDDRNRHQESASGSVKGAIKTGKTVAQIAKGAATGGLHGAALGAVKSSKKWIAVLVVLLLLPVLLLAMLPVVIFGSFFGDGTDSANGITDSTALTENMAVMNTEISAVLSEGLTDVLNRIDADFAASGCDEKEIRNPYGADVVFNANYFISMYCASKNTDVKSISVDDMVSTIRLKKDQLYSYTYQDETRTVEVEPENSSEGGEEESTDTETITVRVYTISYNGEAYFADTVFGLSAEQKDLADNYLQPAVPGFDNLPTAITPTRGLLGYELIKPGVECGYKSNAMKSSR